MGHNGGCIRLPEGLLFACSQTKIGRLSLLSGWLWAFAFFFFSSLAAFGGGCT